METLNAFGQYPGVLHVLILYVIDNEIHHRGQGYVVPPRAWYRAPTVLRARLTHE